MPESTSRAGSNLRGSPLGSPSARSDLAHSIYIHRYRFALLGSPLGSPADRYEPVCAMTRHCDAERSAAEPDSRIALRRSRFAAVVGVVWFVAGAHDYLRHVAMAGVSQLRGFVVFARSSDPGGSATATSLIVKRLGAI